MLGYVLRIIPFIFFIGINFLMADPFKPLDTDFLNTKTPKEKPDKPTQKNEKKNKDKKKAFNEIIKDYEKIEGLFNFYWNKGKNKVYLSIFPEQFEKIYLAGLTRQSGDGYRYDGANMMGEYPFFLKPRYMANLPEQWIDDRDLWSHHLLIVQVRNEIECSLTDIIHPFSEFPGCHGYLLITCLRRARHASPLL